jgi:hypothetical protein
MDGEYSYEWAELRKLRRRIFRVAIAGVAVAALVSVIGVLRGTIARALGVILFVAWVAVLIRFFVTLGEYSYWSCPRCGEPFHDKIRWFGRWNNPFARRCLHCGLLKWVEMCTQGFRPGLDLFRPYGAGWFSKSARAVERGSRSQKTPRAPIFQRANAWGTKKRPSERD